MVGSGDSGFDWDALHALLVPIVGCSHLDMDDMKTIMSPKIE